MKNIYLMVTATLLSALTYAQTFTTCTDGNLNGPGVFCTPDSPGAGDTIIVSAGHQLNIRAVYNFDQAGDKGTVFIVDGILEFFNGGQLRLGPCSQIIVHPGGMIDDDTYNNPNGKVIITDSTVYTSGDVFGPALIDNANTCTAGGPLSATLVNFTAVVRNDQPLLQWSTTQEFNSSYYEIQRSRPGTDWSVVSTVAAAGYSSGLRSYSYVDQAVSSQVLLYRLRMVDKDGKYMFSPVRTLHLSDRGVSVSVRSISPQNILIDFSKQMNSSVVFRVISMSGQVVHQQILKNPVGSVIVNMKNVPEGTYISTLNDEMGFSYTQKIKL
jgi:hypothetical protein